MTKYKSIDREKLQEDILSSALRQDHADECIDDCDDLYNNLDSNRHLEIGLLQ